MNSPIVPKITTKNILGRLLVYILLWFGCVLIAFVPIFIFNELFFDWNFRNIAPYPNEIKLTTNIGIFAGTILATYIIMRREHRTLSSIFITPVRSGLVKGFGIGALFMVVFMILTSLFGIIRFEWAGFTQQFYFDLFFYFMVAISEEIVSRGHILSILKEKFNNFNSLLFSSVFFGLMHLANDHVTFIGIATISTSGFLMGYVTLKTGSISMAVGLHWAWNFFQGAILGLAVSGNNELGIFNPQFLSTPLLTGGNFGAEGSFIMLIINIIVIILFYRFWFRLSGLNAEKLMP